METKLQNVKSMLGELCEMPPVTDSLGVHEMLIDLTVANIEVILRIKRFVIPKIHSVTSAFNAVKFDLNAAKEELIVKEEELKNGRNCSKCPCLEKELILLKKKQSVNESRIKSIAKILTRCVPDSQDVADDDDTDSDESTVTRAYNLVSQMLGCDSLPSTGSDSGVTGKVKTNQNTPKKKSPVSTKNTDLHPAEKKESNSQINSREEGDDSEDDILICSLELDKENDLKEFLSPKKSNKSKSASSPVLGKMKKTPVRGVAGSPKSSSCKEKLQNENVDDDDDEYENSFCIPPSPGNIRSSRNVIIPQIHIQTIENKNDAFAEPQKNDIHLRGSKPKKTADFWQLKSTNLVDRCPVSSKKDGVKLRQAKLAVGCLPKKIDLCDLEEFNGGIRRSQTSTQLSSGKTQDNMPTVSEIDIQIRNVKTKDFKDDEDIIVESPVSIVPNTKRKGGRVFGLGRKLSYDARKNNTPGTSQITNLSSCSLDKQKTSSKNYHEIREEEKQTGLDDSFDCIKKVAVSPNYKYRDGPVRKKNERQKLPGWDCDNCRKYFEAAAGVNASEEELKKLMDRCSRHRDKNPVHPRTPPGFWDAEFPCTADCKDLDITYTDVLPISKKQKKMQ